MPNQQTKELSEREKEILRLVATGASNKEIAQNLFISLNTVKVHLRNIFAKISAISRTEAAMYAVQIGLVETASTQLLSDISNQDTENSNLLLPLPGSFNKSILYRYLALFAIFFLCIVILGIFYFRDNIISTEALIPPTPTQQIQWFQFPDLPTPRRGLAVASYDNRIYAIGGVSSLGTTNIVEGYDPQTNSWTELATKPTPVSDISAAVLGGLIYVPGGVLKSGTPTNIMEIYDPSNNKWLSSVALPQPLSAYGLAVFEGQIYIFGGWDGNQIINKAYIFDTEKNMWTEIHPMPTARSYPGVVVNANKIYVIGGWDGHQALSVNEVYLPDSANPGSHWIQGTPLPTGRYGMGIVNLANIIFIIGGVGSETNLTTIALIPEEAEWGQIENPLQQDWTFLGATNVGTRFYVLGGETKDGLYSPMWSYQTLFTISLPIVR